MDDNFRKSPAREINPTKIQADYCCSGEERAGRRYDGTTKCHRQGDTTSDHELYKLTEEKTSDEGSVTEIETNEGHGDVRPTCHQCDSCPKKYENSSREYSPCTYGTKVSGTHRPNKSDNLVADDVVGSAEPGVICQEAISPNRNQRNFRNYGNPVNLPQSAFVAMKKLERLKELQRRRDNSERFYSQEIRRLIGENFFAENAAIVTSSMAKNRDRTSSTLGTRGNEDAQQNCIIEQRTRGGGFTKEMEPYGTMTTTTRLDCGCVEETIIPIFSSSVGHVKKCESHRYQERPVSKLGPAHPQELSYRAVENLGKHENSVNPCQPLRMRGKNSIDCGQCRNATSTVSRDLESWEDRKLHTRNRRSPRNLSPIRANSPVRKYSDTSSN